MWHWLFSWFVKITGWIGKALCFRTKIYYENKKIQGRHIKGKAIILSNHLSIYDVAVMLFVFGTRTLRCLVAEVMFQKNPLFTFFLKSLGAIKVERNALDFSFIAKSCDILDKGGVIEIYPEARLPLPNEQTPLPFKPSVVCIALQSGASLIPVYTNGKYFQKERARVIIGTPIDARELYDETLSQKENLKIISETLRNKIIELGNELDRQTNNHKTKKRNQTSD